MPDVDVWETAWYDREYRLRVATADGQAFQNLFADVMERTHPGDFLRVRAWGRLGDEKADGYLTSSATVFQCYAPRELTQAVTETKIDRDFAGALTAWRDELRAWVFVHNDFAGAAPWLITKRASLARQHPDIEIELWGPANLWGRIRSLGRADRVALLGPVPPLDQIPRDTAWGAYASHVERWEVLAALDSWNEWTAGLFSADRPALRRDDHDRLVTLGRWLQSRVWPDEFSAVFDALMNFLHVLGDLLEVFHRHDEVDDGWRRTVRYYLIDEWDAERYLRLAGDYSHHVGLVQDLALELARAGNYACDVVRRDLDPTFRLQDAALTVTVGPVEDLSIRYLRPEYVDGERTDRPYPGLETYELTRHSRMDHMGSSEE